MASDLYDRIKELCKRKEITVTQLEVVLGFGNSSIKKWGKSTSPSANKIKLVANYFNVSTDYLLGVSNIESSADDVMGDKDIISIQRAREKMDTRDRTKMMKMLRVSFEHAFSDQEDSSTDD